MKQTHMFPIPCDAEMVQVRFGSIREEFHGGGRLELEDDGIVIEISCGQITVNGLPEGKFTIKTKPRGSVFHLKLSPSKRQPTPRRERCLDMLSLFHDETDAGTETYNDLEPLDSTPSRAKIFRRSQTTPLVRTA